jgi:hypothetical protein
MLKQHVLHLGRIDVFAAADDHISDTPMNPEIPALVDRAEIARM